MGTSLGFSDFIFVEIMNAVSVTTTAKIMTAVQSVQYAILPAITGPITVEIANVELKIAVDVDLGSVSYTH